MDIGGELRAARQARMRSIDDISAATKISPSVLRAIEANAFDTIPGGLFTRGYLRAYAREVSLNPDGIVQRYRDEFEPLAAPSPKGDERHIPDSREPVVDPGDSTGSAQSQILQIAVILVIAVAYLASLRPPKSVSAASPPPIPLAVVAPASADVPVGTSGSTDTLKPHLAVELQATGPCWVDATVDGEHTLARLMNAGERESIAVRDGLRLRVGDPAAFAFTIDGVPGRSLGDEGQAVTVQISRENYASFLAR
jgi:cytoskeleton protein RodZ